MNVKIRKCDHTGDSVLATYDPANAAEVKVAQSELTAFLNKCVEQHSAAPPVWAKRAGAAEFSEIDGSVDSLKEATEVLVHPMVVGG